MGKRKNYKESKNKKEEKNHAPKARVGFTRGNTQFYSLQRNLWLFAIRSNEKYYRARA